MTATARNDTGWKIGDAIKWRITGYGKHYEMEGTIIAWVPKGTSGYAKLPKDAINKRQPKSKAVAAYRVRGKDVNHQNHRFIVRSMVNGVAYFYFPTTTKLVNQSHEK